MGGREAADIPVPLSERWEDVGVLRAEKMRAGPRALAGPGLHELLRLQGWDDARRVRQGLDSEPPCEPCLSAGRARAGVGEELCPGAGRARPA